jgi:hypothetical protein
MSNTAPGSHGQHADQGSGHGLTGERVISGRPAAPPRGLTGPVPCWLDGTNLARGLAGPAGRPVLPEVR